MPSVVLLLVADTPSHVYHRRSEMGSDPLQDLEKRLAEIPEDAVQKPYADPHGAAVTALLVSDWLEGTGTEPELAADLGVLARAMSTIIDELGGEYLPDGTGIPGDLVHRGQAVRAQAIAELEKTLEDAESKAWIAAVRQGIGVVDLVYDLRTLGVLHARRADVLPPEAAKVPTSVRAAADAIEYALRAGEKEDDASMRARLARVWTLLVPTYEKAAAAGRALTRGAGKERAFPALPLVASWRRAQRRPLAVMASASIGSVPPPSGTEMPVITGLPGGATTPPDPEPIAPAGAATKMPVPSSQLSEARCAIRHLLEVEVAVECEGEKGSRFGFTENMSTGGVFVATYVTAKQGTKITVALTMRDGDSVRLAGEVRWQRPSASERWPGLGIKFDDSGAAHEARMHKLLSLRDRVI